MPRARTTATPKPAARGRRKPAAAGSLLQTAERMVGQIEELVAEIAALRKDNDALRSELRDAMVMLDRASAALGGGAPGRRRRAAGSTAAANGRAARATGRRTAGRGRGRATPESVTNDVVLAAVGKVGPASAATIAAELSRVTNADVTGRAVRFLAERAGAKVSRDAEGYRVYSL